MEEIVIGSYDNYLYCLNAEDGSLKWSRYFAGYPPIGPTSLADLDNDGDYEIIAPTSGINVLDHEGNLLWSRPAGGCFRGATTGDLDGDGFLDLVYGASDGVLRCLRGYDGDTLFIFDTGSDSTEIDNAPLVYDFGRDGNLDVFFVGGYPQAYGVAYCLKTDGASQGPGWETFRHDHLHTGCFDGAVGMEEGGPGAPGLRVIVSPNPARGTVHFSCAIPRPGPISLSVYDPVGRLGWSKSWHQETGSHLCSWEPGDASPGVYLYLLRSGQKTAMGRVVIK